MAEQLADLFKRDKHVRALPRLPFICSQGDTIGSLMASLITVQDNISSQCIGDHWQGRQLSHSGSKSQLWPSVVTGNQQ